MKRIIPWIFFSLVQGILSGDLSAQPLFGADELGRTLIQNDVAGNPRSGKHIALFYFLWQGDKGSPTSPHNWDLSEIVKNHPEVLEDSRSAHWGGGIGSYYFWGQPVYGYYRGDDYWVHLKNMQLFTDAGIDLLVLDATNAIIYPLQSQELMKAADAIRAQGKKPPAIVFYTNTASGKTMQQIYNHYYKEGAPYYHPGCWFYLDGKPLIIGVTSEAKGKDYETFFTFRESQWPTVPRVANGWPWISFKRMPEVHYNLRSEPEIANVSVAQHPNPRAGMGGSAFYGNRDNWGRSYRQNKHGDPRSDILYGYNFQEQWDHVLQQDLPFIFVTGWNEWIAGRWKSSDNNPEHANFCDQASPEYSRDIEPSFTAGLKDNYFMQLVNNIRRYKGIEKNKTALPVKNIHKFNDWEKVSLIYKDYTGDTQHRHHPGAQSKPEVIYTNTTGRNDFRLVKVAHNRQHLFFYAETVNEITPVLGDNWMRLYLNWDRRAETGWNGYDYRIIRGNTLQRYSGNTWITVGKGLLKNKTHKNRLMITLPLSLMEGKSPRDFEFKWTDNMQQEDPMDWYINGDAVPGGRFNYAYMPH